MNDSHPSRPIPGARAARKSQAILVASDSPSNASVIARLLAEEFDNVHSSSNPLTAVEDFEACKPSILMLGFDSLEKAERYYLGLYRRGRLIHTQPHRTIMLCNKDEVRRVYELCRSEHFDDYVLFWPMTHDGFRVPMAVHNALRLLAAAEARPAPEVVEGAHRLGEMGSFLDSRLAAGVERIEAIQRGVDSVEEGVDSALSGLSGRLDLRTTAGDAASADALRGEIRRIREVDVGPRLRELSDAVQPASHWLGELKEGAKPYVEAARSIQPMARPMRRVLVIDDDPFQRKLIERLLDAEPVHLLFAASGTDGVALALAKKPHLVLLDFMLPDIDGLEVTRRMRSVAELASVPIVMVTGQSERQTVIECLKAGAADFLVKPFSRDAVVAKVRQFLHEEPAAA
ncbi:MAG TPA: response regulator [Burkholderiaceae bacterium]